FRAAPAALERIAKTRPELAIINHKNMVRSLIVFGLVILGFFLSRAINVEPGIIAIAGGFLMALVCGINVHQVLAKVEWGTIMFFTGLFMLIGSLEVNGFFEMMGGKIVELTSGNFTLTVMVILWSSAILSAIVDNIPLVIAMIPLIKSIVPVFAKQMGLEGSEDAIRTVVEEPLLWSLALGACLGGNGTLIGASANVVISQVARKNKYHLSFWEFTRYGAPMMLLSLVISSFYIYLRYLR
ncbi:MAG: SLC13 family permease, partial [Victivallales bacterium]|nr:SLC13 family permease [Victivallales bacterium]